MGKSRTKKAYKISIVATELKDKKFRKYLYPQEIDGIVFDDDVERKLSESTWFRCMTPKQQIIVEKEMQERARGEFNHKILHYEDSMNEAALGIPKPVMTRLTQTVKPPLFHFIMQLVPYIHINDGILRNAQRKPFTIDMLSELTGTLQYSIYKRLYALQDKRIVFICYEPVSKKKTMEDVYCDLGELEQYSSRVRTSFYSQREIIIYFNPFIVFFGQYLDLYTLPFFVNSGWYVINPYATKIKDWIEINCK